MSNEVKIVNISDIDKESTVLEGSLITVSDGSIVSLKGVDTLIIGVTKDLEILYGGEGIEIDDIVDLKECKNILTYEGIQEGECVVSKTGGALKEKGVDLVISIVLPEFSYGIDFERKVHIIERGIHNCVVLCKAYDVTNVGILDMFKEYPNSYSGACIAEMLKGLALNVPLEEVMYIRCLNVLDSEGLERDAKLINKLMMVLIESNITEIGCRENCDLTAKELKLYTYNSLSSTDENVKYAMSDLTEAERLGDEW